MIYGTMVTIIVGFYINCTGVVRGAQTTWHGTTHYAIDLACKDIEGYTESPGRRYFTEKDIKVLQIPRQ